MPVLKTNEANNTYTNRSRIDAARRVTPDLRTLYDLRRHSTQGENSTRPKSRQEQKVPVY